MANSRPHRVGPLVPFIGLTVLAVIVALAFPTSGHALSGPSGSGSAAAAQYVAIGGETATKTPDLTGTSGNAGFQAVPYDPDQGGGGGGGGGSLAFTGYAVLLALAIGLVLFSGGLLLRRRPHTPA